MSDLYDAANQKLMQKVASGDPVQMKQASDTLGDYVKMQLREDSFSDKIIVPETITDADIDRQVWTDKPWKIVDREPGSPAAVTIPYGQLPIATYIRGSRYPIMFDRVTTPKFTKDIEELRTYRMDIRQVVSDNAIKDLSAERDGKFMQAVNSILGSANSTVSATNTVQYKQISGGITRDTLIEAKKIMPSTPARLRPAIALCNQITIMELEKFGRDEMGGNLSEEVFRNGWAIADFMGMRWIITIKSDLVPDNSVYFFASQDFLGRSYILNDVTMNIKREYFMLEFFAYGTFGAGIGNVAGVARADFI